MMPAHSHPGCTQTLQLATAGEFWHMAIVLLHCRSGCIVMIHQVTPPKNGMSIIASCSPLLAYLVSKPPKNTMYIFFAPQTRHRHSKSLMGFSTSLSEN